jgi:transposase
MSYLKVLEDQIPKCFQPGMTFMQDNALIHTARVVRQWFADIAIPLTNWPPYSPDLNPIEQVWFHMKA